MRLSDISSPPLRLELNASRWLDAALVALALLAGAAIALSALPNLALLLAPPLWWQARRGLHRSMPMSLVFRADGSAARLHGDAGEIPIELRAFVERGPLAVIVFASADGVFRIACAPDTLDAATRRRLRLWAARHANRMPSQHEPAHV